MPAGPRPSARRRNRGLPEPVTAERNGRAAGSILLAPAAFAAFAAALAAAASLAFIAAGAVVAPRALVPARAVVAIAAAVPVVPGAVPGSVILRLGTAAAIVVRAAVVVIAADRLKPPPVPVPRKAVPFAFPGGRDGHLAIILVDADIRISLPGQAAGDGLPLGPADLRHGRRHKSCGKACGDDHGPDPCGRHGAPPRASP